MQPENSEYLRFLAGTSVQEFHTIYGNGFAVNYVFPTTQTIGSSPFYPWDVSEITETQEARASAALKNHKEAEKRRRERINLHLDKLRTILPCNSKMDKASLLAKVVERMRELKEKTSDIILQKTFPSEIDEILVDNLNNRDENKIIIKVSLCCEDRSDLIPNLIQILRSLRLNPLKADIATFGGRIKSVLILSGDKNQSNDMTIALKDSLESLIRRTSSADYRDGFKRRRGQNGS